MSKKRSHNRPKRHPDQRSREPQKPKKNTEEQLASESRRKFLKIAGGTVAVGGVAALAWRLGLSRLFEDRVQEESPKDPTGNTQEEVAQPEPTTTPEWMKGIELPSIEIPNANANWDLEERLHHFSPEVSQQGNSVLKEVKDFYSSFNRNKPILISMADQTEDSDERKKNVRAFMRYFVGKYGKIVKLDPKNPVPICEFNRFLIPNFSYLDFVDVANDTNLAFFDVESIKMVNVQHKGQKILVPLVYLKNQQDIVTNKNQPNLRIDARFIRGCGTMIVCKDCIYESCLEISENFEREGKRLGIKMPPIDPKTISEIGIKSALTHEGAHACLYKIFGIKDNGKNAIKRKGDINMGSYKITEQRYFTEDNRQVHELIALGTGMAGFKETAFIPVYSAAGTPIIPQGYELARYIFGLEILNSPHLSMDLRQEFNFDHKRGYGINHNNIMRALGELPEEELQRIGERVAKLGMYLIQKD